MGKLKPILLSTAMALGATPLMAQEEQFITIGTGGQTGVYYVVGQSICRLVNRDTATTGLRCTAPATGGSIDNINQIRSGGMTMGVAQSDWQFHAYNGSSDYEGDAFTEVVLIFQLCSPLRVRRQPAVEANINAVCRAFVILFHAF